MRDKIKQFYYLLDRPVKVGIPFLIMAFLLLSFLDVIGIGLVGIFLGMLANPSSFAEKIPQINFLMNKLSGNKFILCCGLATAIIFILKTIVTLLLQAKVMFFCKSFSVRLKTRVMYAYQYAPYSYHLKNNSSHLISKIQTGVDYFIQILLSLLNFTSNALITLCILLFLFLLHPFITLSLICMFLFLGWCCDFFSKKKILYCGNIVAELSGEMIKVIQQGLHGLIEIRVLNKEKYFVNALIQVSERLAKATGILIVLQQMPRYLLENIIAIFMVTLGVGAVIAGYNSGTIIAMVGMFAAAGTRLLPAFNQVMMTSQTFRQSYPYMHLIYNDLKELETCIATEYLDEESFISQNNKLSFNVINLMDIGYQYPDTDHLVLENINFDIKKGSSIGLIGSSGAGKSTLVNLILGFLKPTNGNLLVDMMPIQNYRSWLNNFAYIPQTIFLLDDTFRRNIAIGIKNEEINELKILNAIKMAQLTDVVCQLPNGLDTFIGENGIRLSGGQRQRIALARAFYHERDIIIMDEATSALDNETEKEIINTIKFLKGKKTLIVIAHRLTTLEHCDVLYRLGKGRIISTGTFQDVIDTLR